MCILHSGSQALVVKFQPLLQPPAVRHIDDSLLHHIAVALPHKNTPGLDMADVSLARSDPHDPTGILRPFPDRFFDGLTHDSKIVGMLFRKWQGN